MEKQLTQVLEFYRIGQYDRRDAVMALRMFQLNESRIDELLGEVENWITADDGEVRKAGNWRLI